MFEDLKERYRKFCAWQKIPHHVKPMTDEEHVCPTCGRQYVGNFCPQCGQSSKIGRYSMKNAFLLYLDVWGLGNRGMFRTLRDLFLRPGYMIRDYLSGMQMAYFPPFKMFFLIGALSLLINTGLNIKGINRFEASIEEQREEYEETHGAALSQAATAGGAEQTESTTTPQKPSPQGEVDGDQKMDIDKAAIVAHEWAYKNRVIFELLLTIPFSLILYLMVRHCPNIPDMRYSEFLVATVYMMNMLTIITSVISFFCIDPAIELAFMLLQTIPLKQLTGYSYTRSFLSLILAAVVAFIIIILMAAAALAVIAHIQAR